MYSLKLFDIFEIWWILQFITSLHDIFYVTHFILIHFVFDDLCIWIATWFSYFTSITPQPLGNGSIVFDVEFSRNVYVLRSPESKKVVFRNCFVRMRVCLCACDCNVNISHFISPKLIKTETPNFIQSSRLVLR